MKDSKRHHYVTRAYMRRFAINDRVNVLFKNDDGGCFISRKPVNIENICVETNFYTLFEQDKRKNTNVEHMLAEFENKVPNLFFPQIQPDLIYPFREGGIILDIIQKQMIVDAIVVQIARGKSIREYGLSVVDNCYLNMVEAVKRQCEKTPSLMSLLDQLINNEDQIKNNALVEGSVAELLNTGRDSMLWSNLQDRICFVLINTTDLDFITSDEPVLVCDASRKQIGFFHCSLESRDSIIYYPLDPKHMIALYTKEFCHADDNTIGHIIILGDDDREFIKNANIAQYSQCNRCLIAKSKESLKGIDHKQFVFDIIRN